MIYSPLVLMTFAYLVVGLATTIIAWASMPDEIEMSLGMSLDDDDLPVVRTAVTVMFVLSWPVLLSEVLRNNRR